MLHNDGPYGPDDASDNLSALVNMGPIAASSDLSNNMNNLDKIAHQSAQDSSGRYHLPDYPSYNHPHLSLSPQLNPYPGYSSMGFQSNYTASNTTSVHDDSWQSGMLPSHLNQHPFHNQNILNYPMHYQRTSQNQGYSDTSLARNMSINFPQVPAKPYQRDEIELNRSSYSVNHRKYDDYTMNNDTTSKIIEKPLLDSTKRKNLENTVRLIEDILSNTAKNKEMQKNQLPYDFMQENKLQESENSKEKVSKIQNKIHETAMIIQKESRNTKCRNVNQDYKNTSASSDYYENDIIKTVSTHGMYEYARYENHNIDISDIQSEPENKHKKKNNTEKNDIKENNSNNSNIRNDSNTKKETSTSGLEQEDESQVQQKPTFIKVEVENENNNSEKEMSTQINIKVEVEPILWNDFEDVTMFQRDIHGKGSDEVGSDNVIEGDSSENAAREAIKSGSGLNKLYECSHCSLLFSHPKRFLIHHKWHSFGLTNERRMEVARERQMWREQRKEERVMNKKIGAKEKVKPQDSREFLSCKDCDKVFRSKSSLKNHRHRHHPTRYFECEICKEQVLGSIALKAHVAAHSGDGPTHQCPDCDKKFVYAHSLTKHRATHLEKTLQCPLCPKLFGTNGQLKMHQKVHERAERGTTFRCSYCAKGFYESYNLMVHERTHRGERPYLCDICNTSYGTNSSLKRHLKVSHSTSKPFECSICHRSFAAESTRNRHHLRAHGDPDQLIYHCQLCGNRYLHQRDLTKHIYKAHKKGKKKKVSDSE